MLSVKDAGKMLPWSFACISLLLVLLTQPKHFRQTNKTAAIERYKSKEYFKMAYWPVLQV